MNERKDDRPELELELEPDAEPAVEALPAGAWNDVVAPAPPAPGQPRRADTPPPVGATPYRAMTPTPEAPVDAIEGARIDELYVRPDGELHHGFPTAGPTPYADLALHPSIVLRVQAWGRRHFVELPFSFARALWPMVVTALVLFTRWPGTNYIFDEQEALLANPYVNATQGLGFWDAIHRDFWGLAPDRSVGSYRPLPNFLWRVLWHISDKPFFHHLYNVVLHAVNGAILAWIVHRWTRRQGLAYVAGFIFVTSAVLTEAVSGIVGIADVLGGLAALGAIAALSLPAPAMGLSVFLAVLAGLFSKESALVCVPLIPIVALFGAPLTHPTRPARALRSIVALVAAAGAFVLYVELRKVWFPSPLPSDLMTTPDAAAPFAKRAMHAALVWFHQAPLPKDPLNNPLAETDFMHRAAGALRVYLRGLSQTFAPITLSGDYSFPQEPVPESPYFFESIAGAAMMVLPLLASVPLWVLALVRERRDRAAAVEALGPGTGRTRADFVGAGAALTALGAACVAAEIFFFRPRGASPSFARVAPALAAIPALAIAAFLLVLFGLGFVSMGLRRLTPPEAPDELVPMGRVAPIFVALACAWVVISFFPHSNIPVVLPTVRAERFWYFPVIGSSLAYACFFVWWHDRFRARFVPWMGPVALGLFLGFQSLQSYRHAMDYRSDLDFWGATKDAVPNSAKAHLNYSVMKGARKDLATRLTESKIALALAPKWPMAHIYTGDTLCRMHQPDEAWPFYKSGFEVGPNELSLIALALQCLHDEGKLRAHEDELRALAAKHEGSWIAYLAIDTLNNEEKNNGVAPKYRPRGYNEGPRKESSTAKEDDDDDDDPPTASATESGSASAKAAEEDDGEAPSATASGEAPAKSKASR